MITEQLTNMLGQNLYQYSCVQIILSSNFDIPN